MVLEELYPVVAVAYGTFGICFGVLLWWKTQRRIDRTKSAIEIQVANAVKDISGKVDEKLGGLEMPDMAPLMAKVEAITAKFDELDESLPDFDLEPLMVQVAALKQEIPDMVGQHIEMQIKAQRSVEAKAFTKMLEDAGVDIDEAKDELAEFAENQLPPELIATRKLLKAKVPKGVREKHPEFAWLVDTARDAGGDYMMKRMADRYGMGEGSVQVESASRGGSFRLGPR